LADEAKRDERLLLGKKGELALDESDFLSLRRFDKPKSLRSVGPDALTATERFLRELGAKP
jgi:hypothetical protein